MVHTPPAALPRNFEGEVEIALRTVRSAFLELLTAAASARGGLPIKKATDLQRFLEIPSTLAWQVYRIANARNLLAEAEGVPGAKAARKLVRAADVKGIDKRTVVALTDSLAAYERLVQANAENRKAFNSIIAGLKDDYVTAGDLSYRKAAFEANSHIWGSLMRTRLATFVAHPASDTHADILAMFGNIDYYRLHGDTPLVVSKTKFVHEDNTSIDLGRPLTGDLNQPGATILTEFCTRPLQNLKKYVDDEGCMRIEIAPADVGRQHSITTFVAEVVRAVANRHRLPEDYTFGTNGSVVTPTTTHVVDLIIASGTFSPESEPLVPRAYMVGNVEGKWIPFDEMETKYEKQILDQPEVLYLGRGPRVLETPDVPRYPELFRQVCEQLGWDPEIFDVFRCRIEYPVLPSVIGVGFDLLEKGSW